MSIENVRIVNHRIQQSDIINPKLIIKSKNRNSNSNVVIVLGETESRLQIAN